MFSLVLLFGWDLLIIFRLVLVVERRIFFFFLSVLIPWEGTLVSAFLCGRGLLSIRCGFFLFTMVESWGLRWIDWSVLARTRTRVRTSTCTVHV